MNQSDECAQHGPRTRVIAADMPILTSQYPVEQLLGAFEKLSRTDDDVRLILSGKRCSEEIYSVWNFIDQHKLTDRVEFLPYYERCDAFPVKKEDCDVWISRHTPGSMINAEYLQNQLATPSPKKQKHALFFTSFHPEKEEGNSTLMRLWLDHLKRAGYIVHVVYYMYDIGAVNADMRRQSLTEYDIYKEVPVTSKLTGANYNGLNVHVDDWCGVEAMEAVDQLVGEYEYDIAITNYPFMSAIFDRISAYTTKVLLTHDSFVDRNRRMLAQGYPESGWVSLDARGEKLACERSDVVVAMQEHEAEKFRKDTDPEKVCVIGPIFETKTIDRPQKHEQLRIGYFGSSNWVNEQNLGEYLKHWAEDPELMERSEIHIAGGVCKTLKDFVPASVLRKVNANMVGRVEHPGDFFATCDVIINPERGGTGIKIKTLEALAHGAPIITTEGGFVGLESENPLHQAKSFEELVGLTKTLLDNGDELEKLREESVSIYERYVSIQTERMNALLGTPIEVDVTTDETPEIVEPEINTPTSKLRVPEYVQATCSDYHIEEFERFRQREEIRGKRVLEIGSDFHLASARLFMANGAESVLATNIGDWKSDEPLPEGVEFRVCDASDTDLPEQGFDIIYGIAIIEHIPKYEKLCAALKKCLKPDGVIYFQGCPLWAGTLGHHSWYTSSEGANGEAPIHYSFTENNLIPDWAHLAMGHEELSSLLVDKGVPKEHADGIVHYVYNLDGTMVGSCSNFYSASEVLKHLGEAFDVEADPITSKRKPNEYFFAARENYSEYDLRTLGLRLWMTHKDAPARKRDEHATPKVSIVIPFYGVEAFIEECIVSVLALDYPDLEIIFVDDQSPDGARHIVEQYMQKDSRITLVTHEKNQGLGPARNTGVQHANGMYLFFLDSDDYMSSSDAITKLVRDAQSTGCKVVIGSCDRIMTDGQRLNFDRDFDLSHGGNPGTIVFGRDAYLGASFIPGGQYVPMRAWGTLIDRFMYLESGLEYPPAEHEDLPHTPFMYHYAGKVLYSSDIVATYRDRSDSISNTGWDSGKICRQGLIWTKIRENIIRFGLDEHMGDTAVKTTEHLVMKLRQNGIQAGAERDAFDIIEEILTDATGDLNEDLLFYMLDSLRGMLDFQKYDYNLYHKLTGNIPNAKMAAYYRHRLSTGLPAMGAIPIHAPTPKPPASAPKDIQLAEVKQMGDKAQFDLNHSRCQRIISAYKSDAPKVLRKFPSMLTVGDKALYFDAGRKYQFKGSIVDAGCFVGGTTMSLVQGLLRNPLLEEHPGEIEKLIRVYDLFKIDDDYILEHLERNYPKHDFSKDKSFLKVFEDNMREFAHMLDVRPGDVIEAGYQDDTPIEILGVDLCKALPVTDFVVREFFPRLILGARVIQQDFIHQYHPHIHLSMMILEDYFDLDYEIQWGGSVSYVLKKTITPEVIVERFGDDSSWYNKKTQNEMLLKKLEEKMLYDENRWVIMQVLSIYYNAMNDLPSAQAKAAQLGDLFPQFDIPEEVRRLTGV